MILHGFIQLLFKINESINKKVKPDQQSINSLLNSLSLIWLAGGLDIPKGRGRSADREINRALLENPGGWPTKSKTGN